MCSKCAKEDETLEVFVSGAAGFIGKHLVRHLSQVASVVCLIHAKSTSEEDVEMLQALGCRIVFGDITQGSEPLIEAMRGCSHAVHLAGMYSLSATEEELDRINVEGALHVAEAALELGIHLVYYSTVAAWGLQVGVFSELSPRGEAICAYGASKAKADKLIRRLRDLRGLKVTIIFPGPVLGEGDHNISADYIDAITTSPWRGGMPGQTYRHSVHTWLHVHDASDAGIGALTNRRTIGREYLVGGYKLSFEHFNGLIAQIWFGQERLRRPWLMWARGITITAYIFGWIARFFGTKPLWTLTPDSDRVMSHGFAFKGTQARQALLGGMPYREIESALTDYKDGHCSICSRL